MEKTKEEEEEIKKKSSNKRPGIGERDSEEFPEGGRGWLVVAGSLVTLAQSYGIVNTFGQYQIEYESIYPTTKSEIISLVGSLQPCIINLTAVAAVPLMKKFGPQVTVLISMVLVTFGFMMLSLSKTIWQVFLTQGILIGFGMGLCCFAGFAVPQQWFKKKRALASGIVASGSSLGGMVWPIAVSHLSKSVGMPWTNRIIGFIYIPLLLFAAVAIKPRILDSERQDLEKQEKAKQEYNEQQQQLQQEEENIKTSEQKSHHHHETDDLIAHELAEEIGIKEDYNSSESSSSLSKNDQKVSSSPTTSNNTTTTNNTPPPLTNPKNKKYLWIFHKHFLIDWTVINDISFCIFLFSTFMSFLGQYPPLFYLPTYCRRIGASPNVYNYILTIANAASLFGRIVPGYIGDHIGRLNALIPFILFSGISILVFWLPTKSVALTIVFAVTYGAASGSVISLYASVVGQLFGIKGLPSRLTLMFVVDSVPALIGPVIAGSFIPKTGYEGTEGFPKLMIFSAVSFLVGGVALVYLRLSISKKLFVFV